LFLVSFSFYSYFYYFLTSPLLEPAVPVIKSLALITYLIFFVKPYYFPSGVNIISTILSPYLLTKILST